MPARPPPPRLILGLLGGIASGKSTISALLVTRGPGRLVDADVLARTALDQCAKDGRLLEGLGPWALTKAGTPDRKAISNRVFGDPVLLRALERLTHPLVTAQIDEAIQQHRAGKGEPILVLDVPLLLEAGLDRSCDALWFVHAPDADRYARAEKRLHLTRAEVERREAAQSPLDRKRARADLVIDNSGTLEALTKQAEAGLAALGVLPAK